jgi:hypothetical protein
VREQLLNQFEIHTSHRGPRTLTRVLVTSLLFVLIGYLSYWLVYSHFHQISLTRLGNGVGQSSGEGMSPLGFSSALGSSNQPAALVRLEADYRDNPHSPMLYLRETALSKFNGLEMVQAAPTFDTDVSGSDPREPFEGREDDSLTQRSPLPHAAYLLAEHKLAFAVDFPLTIRPLKNPNPSKFKGAFRAYSLAPAYPKGSLIGRPVGDPRWTPAERDHYLKTHPDPRYHQLAQKIAGLETDSIARASAFVAYLSKQSIYTLTPNHTVEKGADQTAPYLFGDMRGYCVHFAHAMVYLLRALGIPARIGTGYLTDLSQAKDGHILLRMSDRHAWAEVYVTAIGWVPFDIQPERVESHADTQVDFKLLEELMGLLEPGEEILPKELTQDEVGFERDWEFSLPAINRYHLLGTLALALVFVILFKTYIRYSWMWTSQTRKRALSSYRAVALSLVDHGFERAVGETRLEFAERVSATLGEKTLSLAQFLTQLAYEPTNAPSVPSATIDTARVHDAAVVSKLPIGKRLRAWVSMRSLRACITGKGW